MAVLLWAQRGRMGVSLDSQVTYVITVCDSSPVPNHFFPASVLAACPAGTANGSDRGEHERGDRAPSFCRSWSSWLDPLAARLAHVVAPRREGPVTRAPRRRRPLRDELVSPPRDAATAGGASRASREGLALRIDRARGRGAVQRRAPQVRARGPPRGWRVVGGHPALGGWNAAGGVKNGDIITIEGASQVEYKWVNGDTWEARENRRLTLPAMDAPDSSVLAVRDRAVWRRRPPRTCSGPPRTRFDPAPSSSQHHHQHQQQQEQEPVRWSPAPAARARDPPPRRRPCAR